MCRSFAFPPTPQKSTDLFILPKTNFDPYLSLSLVIVGMGKWSRTLRVSLLDHIFPVETVLQVAAVCSGSVPWKTYITQTPPVLTVTH